MTDSELSICNKLSLAATTQFFYVSLYANTRFVKKRTYITLAGQIELAY